VLEEEDCGARLSRLCPCDDVSPAWGAFEQLVLESFAFDLFGYELSGRRLVSWRVGGVYLDESREKLDGPFRGRVLHIS